ncbi:bifunctional riboflavin kinase/FAD synthetase [Arcobacter vandammei]|uniref:bifunctional riboflavin kinase/FAD synthetase n=1 Tax=Arcobacter vandammei TaxID=2782243 RepID=UPI0018DFF581|nr:bifunctional riboflavin kinase/FAD synthetase [Arcobacter vandammei]
METMKNSSILVNKRDIENIAIGGFDGMHLAHQELFSKLGDKGAIVCIETGYANLTPNKHRQEYTNYPIYYYVLENIKKLEGFEFIKLLKEEFVNLRKIVVGFDFCFGKNRAYNSESLKEIFDGEIEIINEIKFENLPIHSRYIREFVKDGNIKKANSFLGKNYKIYGFAIKGQGLGKSDFVPTINLRINDFLLPKDGVYITKTNIDNISYDSVSFIGNRETTDNQFAIETHILDKNIEFENLNISIEFLEKIRENKKFDSFLELKNEILNDINIARKYFY